ncbi:hypothetical protein HAX54_042409 [Datura stramonium]|uniref:Uncharacterized protein n=1 Tax=Datura stramonium TaxID=4076 RepID=A0ABS8W1N8_DATST|nr:hypothetical protein [Datura stramonium]
MVTAGEGDEGEGAAVFRWSSGLRLLEIMEKEGEKKGEGEEEADLVGEYKYWNEKVSALRPLSYAMAVAMRPLQRPNWVWPPQRLEWAMPNAVQPLWRLKISVGV